MIPDMPKSLPPRVHAERTRHGKIVWYIRQGHGRRTRLKVGPDDPGFVEAYAAALAATPKPAKSKAVAGSLAWLIELYRQSDAWLGELSPATRKQRECIFRQVIASAGHHPVKVIDRAAVVAGRERRRGTPAQARHYLDTLRGLFDWAVSAQLATTNPADGVKAPPLKKSDGFPLWDDGEVERFEKHYPRGTRERVAFDVVRFTGLRRGDLVKVGRQHERNGIIRYRTSKGDGEWVTIAMTSALAETIAAGPIGDLTYVTNINGTAFTGESFGNWFRDVCRAIGIKKSAHGLRKWYASQLALEGATTKELQAAGGWTSMRMPELYTRGADRARLGIAASKRLENAAATKPPAPLGELPAPRKKRR